MDEAWHKKRVARFKNLHKVKLWKDYRVMYDKIGKEIDAIYTATPDHELNSQLKKPYLMIS